MHRNRFSFLSASHGTAAPFHGCWFASSRLLAVPGLTTAFTSKWNFSSLVPIRDMCASPLVSFHKHALHLKDGTPSSHPHPSHCQYLRCRRRWNKCALFFASFYWATPALCILTSLWGWNAERSRLLGNSKTYFVVETKTQLRGFVWNSMNASKVF